MNDRLARLRCSKARVGTFHSLAFQVLREEGISAGWEVDDKDRYRTILKDACGYRFLDWKTADITVLSGYVGRCKAAAALPGTDKSREMAEQTQARAPGPGSNPQLLFKAYQVAEQIRTERMLLTFDDQLLECWKLLSTNEEARLAWAARWDHVMVDEFQDNNLVETEIAEMLARDHGCYMGVGDVAQSIYRFRGAQPELMIEFPKKWNARFVSMCLNYLSGRRIIEVANKALAAMPPETRLGDAMVAERDYDGIVSASLYGDMDGEGAGG